MELILAGNSLLQNVGLAGGVMGAGKHQDVMEALQGVTAAEGDANPVLHPHLTTLAAHRGNPLGMLGNESEPLTEGYGQSHGAFSAGREQIRQ